MEYMTERYDPHLKFVHIKFNVYKTCKGKKSLWNSSYILGRNEKYISLGKKHW